jgi:hypothetical protein
LNETSLFSLRSNFFRLQVLLPKGDSSRSLWPRVLILQRARSFIRALRKGDLELELATEVLMQENFRLQYRVTSLKNSSSTGKTEEPPDDGMGEEEASPNVSES